jgi:hypothetical protein
MKYQTTFTRVLDKLYRRRTQWLRTILTRRERGRPRVLSRTKRDREIRKLQHIASQALPRKLARKAFEESDVKKRYWRVKGWGDELKEKLFRQWIRKRIPRRHGKIYVLWAGKRCRYVGRTIGSGMRPSIYFQQSWFRGVTRIDVYSTSKKRALPRLECLAIHRFWPTENSIRAAKKKWARKCPVCRIHRDIEHELRGIFSFR